MILKYHVFRTLSGTPEGRTMLSNKFALCPNSILTKPEDISKLTGEFIEYICIFIYVWIALNKKKT